MDTTEGIITKASGQKQKKLCDADIDKLWAQYVLDKSHKETRDRLIVQYIYLIKYVVGRLRMNLPASIATDDIAGYGVEGLIDAIERFIPSKGVRFETYALMRIRGAIIDRIRSQDWVPRGTQRRFKKIQNAILKLQLKLGRAPSTEEIAVEVEITKEKVESTMAEMETNSMVSIYESRDSSGSEGLEIIETIQDTNSPDPLAELEASDVKKELSTALSKLPERERMILALYYHENMTLRKLLTSKELTTRRIIK